MDWAFPDAANELQPLKYLCWCLFARAPILGMFRVGCTCSCGAGWKQDRFSRGQADIRGRGSGVCHFVSLIYMITVMLTVLAESQHGSSFLCMSGCLASAGITCCLLKPQPKQQQTLQSFLRWWQGRLQRPTLLLLLSSRLQQQLPQNFQLHKQLPDCQAGIAAS